MLCEINQLKIQCLETWEKLRPRENTPSCESVKGFGERSITKFSTKKEIGRAEKFELRRD